VADLRVRFEEKEGEAKELDGKFLKVFAELEASREANKRIEPLEKDLVIVREENAALKVEKAGFAEKQRLLEDSQKELSQQFQNTGAEMLELARQKLEAESEQRLKLAEEQSKKAVAGLLKPVEEKLGQYEKSVKEIEADRKKDYGTISGLIDQVRAGQEAVKVEASNIVNSLRAAPKTSGRWGEQQFENLLDMAGLSKFTDFRSEVSVQTPDGILRPDYVINLPGGRELIVDIKCPLDSYLSAAEIIDPVEKKLAFERYSETVKGHANALSKKAYWSQFKKAPDFVILYIPGDNFHSAALEHQPKLWEEAARNRVIISGPATFLPLARTIASMWDQEKLTDKAQEIIDLGRDLHHNLSTMAERIRILGKRIDGTASAYNDFVKSADGNVIRGARKLEELNLTKSDKRLGDFSPVETEARSLTRIEGATDSDTEAAE
jgi:DNA recombination protein RmuC